MADPQEKCHKESLAKNGGSRADLEPKMAETRKHICGSSKGFRHISCRGAWSSLSASMTRHEGSQNKNETRAQMIKLINAAGLDLMALCRAEGESIAQPTKAFLLRIITKYNLQGPSNKPATGIMKFISKDQVDANKGMADNNITSIAETQEAEEDDEEMENEGDIPLNQVTCSISP